MTPAADLAGHENRVTLGEHESKKLNAVVQMCFKWGAADPAAPELFVIAGYSLFND